MNDSTMHTVTRWVSRKAKGSRSLKGVDRLVRLLQFACIFKSSDLKAELLSGYLKMTFVCHLYILEVWQRRVILCLKR